MATLNLKSFATLISDQTAAIQAKSSALLDFTIGSVLRAMVEANSGVVLWLESMALQILAATRAATSTGSDLDSFVNDFGLSRLPGVVSVGTLTFSRFSPVQQVVIPVGATVSTADGSQKFIVVADVTNGAYSAGLGGYVAAGGTASVNVTANSINQAAAANVVAGSITAMTTSIPGIDTVTNALSFTAGQDPETNAALRVRFRAYIASLSKATLGAVSYAIMTTQSGLYYKITENQDYLTGAAKGGSFFVIVDDGTGAPSSTLLASVYTAIDAVRAAGVQFSVWPPNLIYASVALTITTGPSYDHATAVTVVYNALVTYINNLPVGTSLPYTRVIQIAYDASPGVTNVSGVTIKGSTSDLAASSRSAIKVATVSVS